MSKPASRGKPLATPPSEQTISRSARSFMSMTRRNGDAADVDVERVAPVDVVVEHRREQVVRAVIAWKSPVKWRFMSSIGTTWA